MPKYSAHTIIMYAHSSIQTTINTHIIILYSRQSHIYIPRNFHMHRVTETMTDPTIIIAAALTSATTTKLYTLELFGSGCDETEGVGSRLLVWDGCNEEHFGRGENFSLGGKRWSSAQRGVTS